MKEILAKSGGFVAKHKILVGLLGVVAVGAVYFGYQTVKGSETDTRYVLTTVQKGTLVTSVSGSGQVDASSQIDVKPKVSGQVLSLKVKAGQSLKAGDVIAVLDSKNAQKTIRDAQLSLESQQISYNKLKEPVDEYSIASAKSNLQDAKNALEKLKEPPTAYDLTSAQNAVTQSQRALDKAKDDRAKIDLDSTQNLQKAYDDAYVTVSNAYLDLPDLMTDLNDIQMVKTSQQHLGYTSYIDFYNRVLVGTRAVFLYGFQNDYMNAKTNYDISFAAYKTVNRDSTQDVIYKEVVDTIKITKLISTALESGRNMLDALGDDNDVMQPIIDGFTTEMTDAINTANQLLTSLQNIKDTIDTANENSPLDIKNAEAAITSAEENLTERQNALAKLKEGPDASDIVSAEEKIKAQQISLDKLMEGADGLDLQSQELALRQKQNSLADAKETLADYTVRAPFDCVVSKINVNEKDDASSGTSLVTIVSNQLVADVSLNEVDVSKIKEGNQATLTFDAIDDLSISGKVAEIDIVGTVTQGVVTYDLKIAFDTQDARIKPGMSVSAAIIEQVDQDVLMLESGAIKAQGDIHYVDVLPSTNKSANAGAGSSATSVASSSVAENTVSSKATPTQLTVEIGNANDTMTELTGAELKEGDQVVLRTVTPSKTATTTKSATTSLLGGAGGAGGGAGFTTGGGGFTRGR